MSNPNVILIHGNGGMTAEDFWIPEVKSELEAADIEVISPDMPDNIMARAALWLPYMQDALKADEDSIIVGYSSGAVAAMRYAENNRIRGSVLVATYSDHMGIFTEKRSGYFDDPWNWDVIRENQDWIVQLASPSDPFIPIEEARYVHEQLNTEYHELAGRGHFQDYYFPELVTVIKEKLSA